MTTKPLFSITSEEVARWRRDADAHEKAAVILREKIRAVEILSRETFDSPGLIVRPLDEQIEVMDLGTNKLDPGKDLTRAIEKIAAGSARPISKAALKEELRGQGFAADRLSNYFYTAIMRLKNKGRIQVLSDGRVWKPALEKKEAPVAAD